MIKANYHTHNCLCDGRGEIEEYVDAALAKGMMALGFSSHAPIPLANDWTLSNENLTVYINRLEELQNQEGEGRIQIYKGLEIDYIPEIQAPGDARWLGLNLDFSIGSVHSTTGLDRNPLYHCVDGPPEGLLWLLDNIHNASFESLCEEYFTRIAELIRLGGFDFLGHFDLVKKRNANSDFFRESDPWYHRQVCHTLDILENSGIILEINSGGISRNVLEEVYPSPWILAESLKRSIPVVISSDAHRPQDVDFYFNESRLLLKDIGYRESWVLLDGQWTALPL